MKIKKFIIPIIFDALTAVITASMIISLPQDLGSVAVAIFILAAIALAGVPIYCLWYVKKVLANEKGSFLLAFYNSFVITSPCIILYARVTDMYVYIAALWFWSSLWSVLPLVVFRNKENKKDSEEEQI